ncbi:MAG: transcriptional regulator [Treponema sp.]|nr:transcriptional regulator [Treponema sp.]
MFGNYKTTTPRLKRLYEIHKLIASGKKPKAEDLAKEIGCSINTIYKDIGKLEEVYKAPVTSEPKYGGYYYSNPAWRFPLEDEMFGDNLSILSSAKILLAHFENTPLYGDIEKKLNSICRTQDDTPLLNRIALAPSPNATARVKQETWEIIKEALRHNTVIRFRYRNNNWDPDLEQQIIHLRPYQLLIDEGKNIIYGFMEEKKAIRLFYLSNMYEISDTKKKFELPADFDFKNHCGKSHFGAFTRYEPRKYKIAFYEDAIEEIRMGNWADDQEITEDVDEDGNERIVMTFTSAQDMRILDWVFQNKAYAKPLEPESLVTRWKFNVQVMAQMAGLDIKVDYDLLEKADKLERSGK